MLANTREEPSLLKDVIDGALSTFRWCRSNPVHAFLTVSVFATLAYFFVGPRLYQDVSLLRWLLWRYHPEYNYEHGKLVPFIFLGLLWYHRHRLRVAPKAGDNWGLVVVVLGCICFLVGARTMQARIALAAFPLLTFGCIWFLWGWKVARILLFPCAFLLFAVPMAALEQATFHLQFLVINTATAVCRLLGMPLYSVGTTLRPVNGSFGFEIAEGCSGIRSIMAMAMLTAVYVHLTQNRLWKKLLIFGLAAGFAIVGNAGRIVTILLVARFVDPELAGGLYHDYSPFVFFPIALGTMLLSAKLMNIDFRALMPVGKVSASSPGPRYDY
jgi:exosortase